mgnify:CR=1 FL=1|jgi:hypothetical protein
MCDDAQKDFVALPCPVKEEDRTRQSGAAGLKARVDDKVRSRKTRTIGYDHSTDHIP